MKKTFSSLLIPSALLGVALAVGTPSGVALAQQPSAMDVAQARELFNQGLRLRDKGDANGAIEKLKAAHALANTPITGLELGRTYEQVGKLVEARETLLSIGRIAVQPTETPRASAGRVEGARMAEDLRARIPSLTVKVTGVPIATVAVSIDGASVPSEVLEAPRPVNPGSHEVFARSTTGGTAQTTVDLKEGDAREVELKIAFVGPAVQASHSPSGAPGTPTESPPPQASKGLSPVFYAGASLAGAGLVVGGITGALALSKASSVRQGCPNDTCSSAAYSDLQSGRTLGNVSTVGFIAAGVGAVVGVIGFVLSPHHDDSAPKTDSLGPTLGPGGAGIQGTF
jgi:hypothetical protein